MALDNMTNTIFTVGDVILAVTNGKEKYEIESALVVNLYCDKEKELLADIVIDQTTVIIGVSTKKLFYDFESATAAAEEWNNKRGKQ